MKNNTTSNVFSFSILMANYNNAEYITEAIESVISQTYPHWELIIVDDVSTDNSIEKITPFLKDRRIKLIVHKKNIGYGGSLRTAADNASNTILAVLDSDDKLHENALEIMAQAYIDNPGYGFIYSTYWICDSNLKNSKVAKWIEALKPNETNLQKNKISHFKTFRRDIYLKTEGFAPRQKRGVDKDIIFKLEEKTKLKFIDKPLYYYRWHEKGISQGKTGFEAGVYYYFAKLKAYRRRLNTDIPNLRKRDLYLDYLKIRTYGLNQFLVYLNKTFKFSLLTEKILKLRSLPRTLKEIANFLDRMFKFP